MKKNLIILSFIVAVIVMSLKNCSLQNQLEVATTNWELSEQSLRKEIDRNGQVTYSANDLQVQNQKLIAQMEAKTEEAEKLKQMAKDYKRLYNAVSLTAQVDISGSTATIILPGDTVYQDSLIYLYPVYTDSISTTYRKGRITAGKDSINYSIRETVPISIAQHKSGSFFKKKVATITIKSDNPAVDITGVSSFSLKEPRKRWAFGPCIGAGVDNKGKFSTTLGLGLTFVIL